ncbi:FlgD immunoglobulin-like domain containing protein [Streptomyces spinosirectus]
MTRSRRLAGLAVTGAVALSCAGWGIPAQAAPDADTPVATVQLSSSEPTEVRYLWSGASGFQYTLPEGGSGASTTVDYPGYVPPQHAGPDDLDTGNDVSSSRSGSTVTQKHHSTGATATVHIPDGQTYEAASGWSVLTQDGTGVPHVLRAAADGTTTDLPVTGLPSGARPTGYVTGGSVRRAAVVYTLDGATGVGLVDLADGTFRAYLTGTGSTPKVVLNDRWLVAGSQAIRVDSAPGTPPTAITAPHYGTPKAIVGDQLLTGYGTEDEPYFLPAGVSPALWAVSLTDNTTHTLLTDARSYFTVTPDGGLLATAGPSAVDWHVHRVTPTADGAATTAKAQDIPAWQAQADGLALAGGELQMYGDTTRTGGVYGFYTIPLDATGRPAGLQTRRGPTLSPASPCLTGDAACPQMEGLGDGRVAYLWTDSAGEESVNVVGEDTATIRSAATGDAGGRLLTGTGRYALYNGGTAGVQEIADFPGAAAGSVTLSRTRTAAALWGQRLWTPGGSQGQVVAYDLKARKNVATVDTGAPCTPSELQAVNAWLYWTCGTAGPAGVYDRATGRAITVPAGQARLADGYLLRENRTTHELLLTDFHTGTATTRTVAVLPTADHNTGGSNGRWAVDRFGGNIAYLTGKGQVALVTANVPTSPLAQLEAQTGPVVSGPTTAAPWKPVWQLSKPSAWTLTLKTAAGATVRTLIGDSTAAAVRPAWDGYRQDGTRAPGGTYAWTLTARPRDAQGPDLTLTGTTTVN